MQNGQPEPKTVAEILAALTATRPGVGELVPELMKRVGFIGKERNNQKQNYQFRGIDDVLNFVGPPAAEIGLRAEVRVSDHARTFEHIGTVQYPKMVVHVTLKMVITLVAPDGSTHTMEGFGEAMDYNGDKATNKAMASAFKYACFFGLIIPVDGVLDDGDTEGLLPEEKRVPIAKTKRPSPKDQKAKADLEKAAGKTETAAIEPDEVIATVTTKQMNAIAALKKELKWSDAKMKECVGLVQPGEDNAANLTSGKASEIITRMQAVLAKKKGEQA